MYKSMYDKSNRFYCVSSMSKKANTQKQKGEWERLLCSACEQKLSKYERYASLLLKNEMQTAIRQGKNVIEISSVDYKLFKLFQISILWRASISNRPIFKEVSLGEKHEEIVRNMLLNDEPGKHYKYGCIMLATMHSGKHIDSLILQPEIKRIDGQISYRFVFGGFWWLYFCSSHKPNNTLSSVFLQRDGIAYILLKELDSAEHVVQFALEASLQNEN